MSRPRESNVVDLFLKLDKLFSINSQLQESRIITHNQATNDYKNKQKIMKALIINERDKQNLFENPKQIPDEEETKC